MMMENNMIFFSAILTKYNIAWSKIHFPSINFTYFTYFAHMSILAQKWKNKYLISYEILFFQRFYHGILWHVDIS